MRGVVIHTAIGVPHRCAYVGEWQVTSSAGDRANQKCCQRGTLARRPPHRSGALAEFGLVAELRSRLPLALLW